MLLEIISFNPSLLYNILGVITIVITGIAFFFNLKNKVELVKNDLTNQKDYMIKLEEKVNASESKIEHKINDLEIKLEDRHRELNDKIERLPVQISEMFKNLFNNK